MAPTLSMSVTGVQVVRLLGRAAPLGAGLARHQCDGAVGHRGRGRLAAADRSADRGHYLRLGTGHAPGGQTLTADVFKLPRGTGAGAIGLAGIFGILSFGGFESSISAGEESRRPAEAIPRSVVAAVLFGAVFHVFCVSGQSRTGPGPRPAR
jgi:hypothetical protein